MSKNTVFGRQEPHTVIIARGDEIRHFTIRPWVFALCGCVLASMALGYLVGTTYLILRDDLLNATAARQARLQHAYEDRISSLRSQVDRITSHRLLDQQVMESKIAELANRQSLLAHRASVIQPMVKRATDNGLEPGANIRGLVDGLPIPSERPGSQRASLEVAPVKSASLFNRASSTTASDPFDKVDPQTTGSVLAAKHASLPIGTALSDVNSRLSNLEFGQVAQLASLRAAAQSKHDNLVSAAKQAGLNVRVTKVEQQATGGPLLPLNALPSDVEFAKEMQALNTALAQLDHTRATIKSFPIAHPAIGHTVSSRFGNRRDPIIGRTAFHAGIDFRTPTGTKIRSTADGKVTKAGRKGGYGKMIEVQHANGLTTRYAHLSRIHVKVGDRVKAGQKIASSGNTGRSTGPHLHYEVRFKGKPVNPAKYLNAGAKLGRLL